MRKYMQAERCKVYLEARDKQIIPQGRKRDEKMEKMTTGEFGKRFGLETLQASLVVGFLKGLKIIKECGKQENAPGQKGRSPVLYSFPSVISIRVKGKAKKSKPKAKKTVAPVAAPVAPVAPVAAPVTA